MQRAILALWGMVLGFHRICESDPFWHLMLGREVLRHGSRVVPEPTALVAWSNPCFVPEWLWDIFTYGVYRWGGYVWLSLLSPFFGALAGYFICVLLERGSALRSRALVLATGALALCAVAFQLDVRPNLGFFPLLLAFMWLAIGYGVASPEKAPRLALALVALTVLWAQIHASFTLAPAIFLAAVVPARVREGVRRTRLRLDGLVLLGILLSVLTCAFGLDVVALVLRHSGGDATRHIIDMKPFDWDGIAPFAWPKGAVISVLFVTGLFALILEGGQLNITALLLALLGAAMTNTARRFIIAWVLMLLPWAGSGIEALTRLRVKRPRAMTVIEVAYFVIAILVAVWTFNEVDRVMGPLFRTGLKPGQHPLAASRYLARLPKGAAVFTDYDISAPLGFWSDGRIRTFVDGRTPLYFDETDYGVARDMMMNPDALRAGIERYRIRAVVVSRDVGACNALAAQWAPVVIEPRYTTFVPRDADAPLIGINTCGPFYLNSHSCDNVSSDLLRSIKRLGALHASAFVDFLRAAELVQCGRGRYDQALKLLRGEGEARTFLPQYRFYRIWALLGAGHTGEATALLSTALAQKDAFPVRLLTVPVSSAVSVSEARRLLEQGIEMMDDSAPPSLRAWLALICVQQGDAECARFQGLRAALGGAREALAALQWAMQHHPSAQVRRDLQHWLATFNAGNGDSIQVRAIEQRK
jgi:hypothetical protein